MANSRCWRWLRERFTRFHTNFLCPPLRWSHFLRRVASNTDFLQTKNFKGEFTRRADRAQETRRYPHSIFAAVWFYLEHTSSLWGWDIKNELNYIWGCWLRTVVLWSPSYCWPERRVVGQREQENIYRRRTRPNTWPTYSRQPFVTRNTQETRGTWWRSLLVAPPPLPPALQ